MAITIDNNLKRQAVLNEVVRALKRRLTPIRSFAHALSNKPVRLEGNATIAVPYVPLDTTPSTDWNPAVGYATGDGSVSAKVITFNKRKFQSLSNTSQDERDQPFLLTDEILAQKVDQLVQDVTTDVASMVTLANYGAAAWVGAAAAFNISAVSDLRAAATNANWPDGQGSLVLNPTYDSKFILDSAVISALNYGSNEAVRTGTIPQVLNFKYGGGNPIPANGQNLVGWISLPSAGAVAMAPVAPAAAVRDQLLAYETYTDPDQSFVLTYREWGDPNLDVVKRIIECAYGYAPIESAALKRITSA
jgi:hypothetical protein